MVLANPRRYPHDYVLSHFSHNKIIQFFNVILNLAISIFTTDRKCHTSAVTASVIELEQSGPCAGGNWSAPMLVNKLSIVRNAIE